MVQPLPSRGCKSRTTSRSHGPRRFRRLSASLSGIFAATAKYGGRRCFSKSYGVTAVAERIAVEGLVSRARILFCAHVPSRRCASSRIYQHQRVMSSFSRNHGRQTETPSKAFDRGFSRAAVRIIAISGDAAASVAFLHLGECLM